MTIANGLRFMRNGVKTLVTFKVDTLITIIWRLIKICGYNVARSPEKNFFSRFHPREEGKFIFFVPVASPRLDSAAIWTDRKVNKIVNIELRERSKFGRTASLEAGNGKREYRIFSI